MDRAEIIAIAEAAAKAAVDTTLLRLGIDVNEPEEFTKTRDAIAYARRLNDATQTVKKAGLTAAAGALITAGLAILWLGFQAKLLELFK
jgi:hypothetical protein